MNKADLARLMARLTVRPELQRTVEEVPVGPLNHQQAMDCQRDNERDWRVAEQKEYASLKSHGAYDVVAHQQERPVPPMRK